jgi:molybdopterin-guanine dinucleotide biosynthesis protein A
MIQTPKKPYPITGVVLAGGQSQRLQQDKRKLRLWGADGPTLLEHTLALISPLCAEVVVVLNDPWEWPHLAARLVSDTLPGMGPPGGLVAGLGAARLPYALVVGADMPLLDPHLLAWMIEEYRLPHRAGAEALVPQSPTTSGEGQIEPLHAIYARACLPRIEAALAAGTRRMSTLLEMLRTVFITPAELVAFEQREGMEDSVQVKQAFLNINTPADLALARRLLYERSRATHLDRQHRHAVYRASAQATHR